MPDPHQASISQVDEGQAIAAAQRDPSAFDALYRTHVQSIYRYLYSRTGNQQDAEELTAQTFLAALERLPGYRHRGYFSAWLFAIARNKLTDHFRRRPPQTGIEDAAPIALDGNLAEELIQREGAEILARLISALPDGERELLRLRFVAELSFAEMAELLHKNSDAVKKSLYRLLARLQAQIEVRHE